MRKFQLLASRFVGQVVAKVGGSTRKINVDDLKSLRLQGAQVSCAEGGFIPPWQALEGSHYPLACQEPLRGLHMGLVSGCFLLHIGEEGML